MRVLKDKTRRAGVAGHAPVLGVLIEVLEGGLQVALRHQQQLDLLGDVGQMGGLVGLIRPEQC